MILIVVCSKGKVLIRYSNNGLFSCSSRRRGRSGGVYRSCDTWSFVCIQHWSSSSLAPRAGGDAVWPYLHGKFNIWFFDISKLWFLINFDLSRVWSCYFDASKKSILIFRYIESLTVNNSIYGYFRYVRYPSLSTVVWSFLAPRAGRDAVWPYVHGKFNIWFFDISKLWFLIFRFIERLILLFRYIEKIDI